MIHTEYSGHKTIVWGFFSKQSLCHDEISHPQKKNHSKPISGSVKVISTVKKPNQHYKHKRTPPVTSNVTDNYNYFTSKHDLSAIGRHFDQCRTPLRVLFSLSENVFELACFRTPPYIKRFAADRVHFADNHSSTNTSTSAIDKHVYHRLSIVIRI